MLYIGTNHFDLDGPEKLREVLGGIKGGIVTVEALSDYSLDFLTGFMEKVRLELANFRQTSFPWSKFSYEEGVEKMVHSLSKTYGYEVIEGGKMALKNGFSLVPIDSPGGKRFNENPLDTTFAIVNKVDRFTFYNILKGESEINFNYNFLYTPLLEVLDNFSEQIKKQDNFTKGSPNGNIYQRNLFMGKRIKKLKPKVHIGGNVHIIDKYLKLPLHIAADTPYAKRIFL